MLIGVTRSGRLHVQPHIDLQRFEQSTNLTPLLIAILRFPDIESTIAHVVLVSLAPLRSIYLALLQCLHRNCIQIERNLYHEAGYLGI
jgi:hypothetical protein